MGVAVDYDGCMCGDEAVEPSAGGEYALRCLMYLGVYLYGDAAVDYQVEDLVGGRNYMIESMRARYQDSSSMPGLNIDALCPILSKCPIMSNPPSRIIRSDWS